MPDSITVHTVVPVSPQQAWDAFTTPAALMQWNQASPDWHCPSAEVDLRVGGEQMLRMEARDGSFGFDFEGIFEEVDAPHALTLRLNDGRRARTTFASEGDRTRVATTFEPESTNSSEMQRTGWQAILDSYAAHLTGQRNT